MEFLTPTINYLHSIFECSAPSTPTSKGLQDVRHRVDENDPFAAAFHAANYAKPTREYEQTADPFNLFCDIPASPSETRFFEPSPPDSNPGTSAPDIDTHKLVFHDDPSKLEPQQYFNEQEAVAKVATTKQPYLLPPTPPTIVYESPYANPSQEPANVPPQLKQRRRGPKPKNLARTAAEKEEVRNKFLERNKHAAKRCRERKKLGVEATLKQLREQEDAVLQLQVEKDLLEEEVARLKRALESCACGQSNQNAMLIPEVGEREDGSNDDNKEMEDWLVSSPRAEDEEMVTPA